MYIEVDDYLHGIREIWRKGKQEFIWSIIYKSQICLNKSWEDK